MADTSKWATHTSYSKGDAPRRYSKSQYDMNFDAINWSKNKEDLKSLHSMKKELKECKTKEEKLKILFPKKGEK